MAQLPPILNWVRRKPDGSYVIMDGSCFRQGKAGVDLWLRSTNSTAAPDRFVIRESPGLLLERLLWWCQLRRRLRPITISAEPMVGVPGAYISSDPWAPSVPNAVRAQAHLHFEDIDGNGSGGIGVTTIGALSEVKALPGLAAGAAVPGHSGHVKFDPRSWIQIEHQVCAPVDPDVMIRLLVAGADGPNNLTPRIVEYLRRLDWTPEQGDAHAVLELASDGFLPSEAPAAQISMVGLGQEVGVHLEEGGEMSISVRVSIDRPGKTAYALEIFDPSDASALAFTNPVMVERTELGLIAAW